MSNYKVPEKTVRDMIALVEEQGYFDKPDSYILWDWIVSHRVLVVSESETADFSKVLMEKFDEQLSELIRDADQRYSLIVHHLLYVTCDTVDIAQEVRSELYGGNYHGHVYNIKIADKDDIEFDRIFREELLDMKFGLVVGNPPYNGDVYIDFVMKGHEMASKYSLWITPAKWGSRDNAKELRNTIKSHLMNVVYYISCYDIFNITAWGGVTYYLIDKNNKYDNFRLINKCAKYKAFNGDTIESVNKDYYSFNIFGESIVKKLGDYHILSGRYDSSDKYFVHVNNTVSMAVMIFSSGGSVSVLPNVYVDTDKEFHKNIMILYSSNDEDKCKSCKSYLSTKFIRFLLLVGVNIQNPFTKTIDSETNKMSLRYVPMPDAFDHIFTDAELYKKYNLTNEEINVIESVIKELK